MSTERKSTAELVTGDHIGGERVESLLVYVNEQGTVMHEWRLVSLSSWEPTGEVIDGEEVGMLSTRTVRAHIDVMWKVAA